MPIEPVDYYNLDISFRKRKKYIYSYPQVKIHSNTNVNNTKESVEDSININNNCLSLALPHIPQNYHTIDTEISKPRKRIPKRNKLSLSVKYLTLNNKPDKNHYEDFFYYKPYESEIEHETDLIHKRIIHDMNDKKDFDSILEQLEYLDNIPNIHIENIAEKIVEDVPKAKKPIVYADPVIHNVYFQFILDRIIQKIEIRNQLNQFVSKDQVVNMLFDEINNFQCVAYNLIAPSKKDVKHKLVKDDYKCQEEKPKIEVTDNSILDNSDNQINSNFEKYKGNFDSGKKTNIRKIIGIRSGFYNPSARSYSQTKDNSSIFSAKQIDSSQFSSSEKDISHIKKMSRNNSEKEFNRIIEYIPEQTLENFENTKYSKHSSSKQEKKVVQAPLNKQKKSAKIYKPLESENIKLPSIIKTYEKQNQMGTQTIANNKEDYYVVPIKRKENNNENKSNSEEQATNRSVYERNTNGESISLPMIKPIMNKKKEISKLIVESNNNVVKKQERNTQIKETKKISIKQEIHPLGEIKKSPEKKDEKIENKIQQPNVEQELVDSKKIVDSTLKELNKDIVSKEEKKESEKPFKQEHVEEKKKENNEVAPKQLNDQEVLEKEVSQVEETKIIESIQPAKQEIEEILEKEEIKNVEPSENNIVQENEQEPVKHETPEELKEEKIIIENNQQNIQQENEQVVLDNVISEKEENQNIENNEQIIDQKDEENKMEIKKDDTEKNEEQVEKEEIDKEEDDEENEEENLENDTLNEQNTIKRKGKTKKTKRTEKRKTTKKQTKNTQSIVQSSPEQPKEKEQKIIHEKPLKSKDKKRTHRNSTRNHSLPTLKEKTKKEKRSSKITTQTTVTKQISKKQKNNNLIEEETLEKEQCEESEPEQRFDEEEEEERQKMLNYLRELRERDEKEREMILEHMKKELEKQENEERVIEFLEQIKKNDLTTKQDEDRILRKMSPKHNEILEQLLLRDNPNFVYDYEQILREEKENKNKLLKEKEIIQEEDENNTDKEIRKRTAKQSLRKQTQNLAFDSSYLFEKYNKKDHKETIKQNVCEEGEEEVQNEEELILPPIDEMTPREKIELKRKPKKKVEPFFEPQQFSRKFVNRRFKYFQDPITRLLTESNKQKRKESNEEEGEYNKNSLEGMMRDFVKKIKQLKNLNSADFAKEMETFIDSQIDSTDYSAMRRREYRMNEFVKKLTKFRTQKEENRITKLNKLAFKRPLNFYYPKENDHEDLHDNNNLSS